MMMNQRAWLYEAREFYTPPSLDVQGLVEFYTVLEGYRRKGKTFEVDFSSGVVDVDGREIFYNDLVEVVDDDELEIGIVKFDSGSFMITNPNSGYEMDISFCTALEGGTPIFTLRIIGNVYTTDPEELLSGAEDAEGGGE